MNSFSDQKREDACRTIQNCWWRYIGPTWAAVYISLNLEIDENIEIHVMRESNAKIMEYCVRVLSGRQHRTYWKFILGLVRRGLWVDEFTGGPGARFYIRVENACDTLIERFGFTMELMALDAAAAWEVAHVGVIC
jgi:hypothetical protein